ncbi:hypothetical protein F511_37768 [Dorcoceras hygrometricum]|uniref:Uncharacterized protein n=1 Tax=Dorcoceras hygrometricum TaxID=472368 RepID=A0A2Z7CR46_9LAMI|nr:hypothetical protein F511_37768 [Dorcoceras hygrometricum]
MAKASSVKAGSFNAITVEKFSLMTAVICGVRMNWAKILFSILKKMVTPGSKQAKGFAVQISLLLENIPTLRLGESSEFPASKILNDKTMHRFVSLNDKAGAEEVFGASKPTAVSKKRRAADFGAAVTKNKRTIKKKSVSSLSTLEMVAVAQEAVPIQQVEEPSAVEETRCPSADDVDFIIQQVIEETREVDAPADKDQPAATEEKHWFDLPYEDLIEKWAAEQPVVTASDTDEADVPMDVGTAGEDQQNHVLIGGYTFPDTFARMKSLAKDNMTTLFLHGCAKRVQEVNAKVDIMASRLHDVKKRMLWPPRKPFPDLLFEFQSQAQENQNILHAQLSELVDYIHRGRADKKGESGSRGLQQTSNVQIEGSAERTPTFAQRVEMAQRHIVQIVLDADAKRELLERQAAAERDRERKRREARILKRRRRD